MTLQEDINEYISLDTEIKRRAQEVRQLRQQREEIETQIALKLDEKKMPGFKYKNMAVLLVKKNTRHRKRQIQKKEDIANVLRYNENDKSPEETVEDIIEAMRGELSEKLSIKIQRRKV